ncbi:MAG: hypothetical protein ACREUX_16740 [Burkholderiales bacterium]
MLLLACGNVFAQSPADAQGYPGRPIRIIVANTAGSAMDNVTRMIGSSASVNRDGRCGDRSMHGIGARIRTSRESWDSAR